MTEDGANDEPRKQVASDKPVFPKIKLKTIICLPERKSQTRLSGRSPVIFSILNSQYIIRQT